MARRRMISLDVIDSDRFLDMPPTSQMFYVHLLVRADDDGFVQNPRRIQRMVGAGNDDFKLLIAKGYMYSFLSGYVVITDWGRQNKVQPSRRQSTFATNELAMLVEENGVYKIAGNADLSMFSDETRLVAEVSQTKSGQMSTKCRQNVDKMSEQDRLGKDRLGNSASFDAGNTHHKKNSSTLTAVEKSDFEKLWALYPNKKGKEVASKAYLKAIRSGVTNKQIQSGIVMYKKEIEYKGTEKAFIKHGSTWFNQAGWEDEYEIGSSNSQMNVDTTAEIDNLKIQLNQTDISAAQRQALERRIERLEKDVS